MFYYAQINENNICVGVSQLSGKVNAPNMILLESYNGSVLGKKYNDGTWEDVPIPDPPEPTPTAQDVLYAEVLKQLNEINLKLSGGETSV